MDGARSSNYKYLAPSNHILFFPAEEMLILPSDYPKVYGKPMQWGTYIKLLLVTSGNRTKPCAGRCFIKIT